MRVSIASDHRGIKRKEEIINFLKKQNIDVVDLGPNSEESVDYPVYAFKVCDSINNKESDLGILLCGTGIGMSIAANKVKGIRAAHCTDYFSAKYTRLHNDANVLCLGERITGAGLALELVKIFLETEFEGGRHATRIAKIAELEK